MDGAIHLFPQCASVVWCSVKAQGQLYKALIRSVITYACPAWVFAADIHLLKLQLLEGKVLSDVDKLPRLTSTRALHMVFEVPYVYDYVTEICRKQPEVIQDHEDVNIWTIGQSEAQSRKFKSL